VECAHAWGTQRSKTLCRAAREPVLPRPHGPEPNPDGPSAHVWRSRGRVGREGGYALRRCRRSSPKRPTRAAACQCHWVSQSPRRSITKATSTCVGSLKSELRTCWRASIGLSGAGAQGPSVHERHGSVLAASCAEGSGSCACCLACAHAAEVGVGVGLRVRWGARCALRVSFVARFGRRGTRARRAHDRHGAWFGGVWRGVRAHGARCALTNAGGSVWGRLMQGLGSCAGGCAYERQ
jgi:hypothetical protein